MYNLKVHWCHRAFRKGCVSSATLSTSYMSVGRGGERAPIRFLDFKSRKLSGVVSISPLMGGNSRFWEKPQRRGAHPSPNMGWWSCRIFRTARRASGSSPATLPGPPDRLGVPAGVPPAGGWSMPQGPLSRPRRPLPKGAPSLRKPVRSRGSGEGRGIPAANRAILRLRDF